MAHKRSITLDLNGYTDLPEGKIASVVTYLELRTRPRLPRRARPAGWSLRRLTSDDLDRYRKLYCRVGEPWLWFSRVIMPDEELRDILTHPKVEAYALNDGAADIGILELDFRSKGEAELAFLGLAPDAIGHGAGRFLMDEAIKRAFAKPIRRFFVHTCSLDHPSALAFYMRAGFIPYKRAIEVADDPRLLGFLPLDSAPHVPLLAEPETKRARRNPARPRKLQTREAG